MLEPALHGGATTVDEILKKFYEATEGGGGDGDTDASWIDSEEADANAMAFEAMFPPGVMPQPDDVDGG